MQTKAGIFTSEFYVTLITNVLMMLVLSGVVSPGDESTLSGALTNAVTAVFSIIASISVIVTYIRSRTAVKAAAMQAHATIASATSFGGSSLAAQPQLYEPGK